MTFVPVMWAIWCILVLATAFMYVYRGRLTRDEEDQIFLDESFSHEQAAQAEITAKVGKLQPILKTLQILVVVATVLVIGYYIWDIVTQFK
jgi:uncharacterized ion transporter superfamily protein YfcC